MPGSDYYAGMYDPSAKFLRFAIIRISNIYMTYLSLIYNHKTGTKRRSAKNVFRCFFASKPVQNSTVVGAFEQSTQLDFTQIRSNRTILQSRFLS